MGRIVSFKICPKGEGRAATLRISEAIPEIRALVNMSLSYLGFDLSIASKSRLFSFRRYETSFFASSATDIKIEFIVVTSNRFNLREAFFTALRIPVIDDIAFFV